MPANEPLGLSWPMSFWRRETCRVAIHVDLDPEKQTRDFHCAGRPSGAHDRVDSTVHNQGQKRGQVIFLTTIISKNPCFW